MLPNRIWPWSRAQCKLPRASILLSSDTCTSPSPPGIPLLSPLLYADSCGRLQVNPSPVPQSASKFDDFWLTSIRASVNNPSDAAQWQTMTAIKTNILRRMDTATPGLRVCCIKFVQQVVQTQTPGVIADPRVRPFQNPLFGRL